MVGVVLRENDAMRDLVRTQGFVVDTVASDADALRYVLTLSPLAETPATDAGSVRLPT